MEFSRKCTKGLADFSGIQKNSEGRGIQAGTSQRGEAHQGEDTDKGPRGRNWAKETPDPKGDSTRKTKDYAKTALEMEKCESRSP